MTRRLHYNMQSAPLDQRVTVLYEKALAAGLSKVTATAFKYNFINYQTKGRRSHKCSSVFATGTDDQMNAFKGSLEGTELEGLEVELQMGPRAGDDCPAVKAYATANGEERTFEWAPEDPKVYLLDFWATWCGPCQHPMAHNQEMLAKNPEWEGKAEIVAISLDGTKEEAQKRIHGEAWTSVSSYWAGEGGFRAAVPSEFKVNEIPTCLLVKKGKVLWRGHPSERDLEADIKHLVANDELPKAGGSDDSSTRTLPEGEMETKLAEVEAILNSFVEANRGLTSPYFAYIPATTISAEGIKTSLHTGTGGSFLLKHKAATEPLEARLKEMFPSIEARFEYVEPLPEISRGEKCVLCDKALTEADVQFLCPYCEPKHYHCQACEDLPRGGAGSAKLAHPHKLYKITPLSSHFDELRFGTNFPQDKIRTEDPENRTFDCSCDNRHEGGCDGEVKGVRWKCAHCCNFDFCEACEKLFWDVASEERKQAVKGRGHDEFHVLLKIPFP